MSPTENYANYRTRFLLELARALVLPPLATWALLKLAVAAAASAATTTADVPGNTRAIATAALTALGNLSTPAKAALLAASVPFAFFANTWLHELRQQREIRRLGARPVPRVHGRWPGNLDMVLGFPALARVSYTGSVAQEIFDREGVTVLNFRFLWQDSIVSIDEQHIKYVLATGFKHFEKGDRLKVAMESFLGNGIFNRDGEVWKMHRAMTRPFFARERVTDFETFGLHATTALGVLARVADSSLPFLDVQDFLARFTLDAASDFLFGDCVNTLHSPLPVPGKTKLGPKGSLAEDEFGSFAAAFEDAQIIVTERLRTGRAWALYELFHDKSSAPNHIVKEWLRPRVEQAVLRHEQNLKDGAQVSADESDTLLTQLVASTKDKDLIRDELLNILLAGRDTTACLLTFTTYLLSLHPEVAAKLRQEIAEHCAGGMPTHDTLKEMKYMRAVLNETLRLFPPVPGNTRQTNDEATLLPASDGGKPYYMPGNTTFNYLPILLHKRRDLWGPDADAFDPERWLDERAARLVTNPFMFVPFNAGPRICLGQQFAYHETSFFLCVLLPKFSFELAPQYAPEGSLPPAEWKNRSGRAAIEKCWPANALTLYAKGGLWMKVTRLE